MGIDSVSRPSRTTKTSDYFLSAGNDRQLGPEDSKRLADIRVACRVVKLITQEMSELAGDKLASYRLRRKPTSLVRQIAMYVCHVALQFSLSEIGHAFGRDRTTVAYACRIVEDRRDDRDFDEFIAALERLAHSVISATERGTHA